MMLADEKPDPFSHLSQCCPLKAAQKSHPLACPIILPPSLSSQAVGPSPLSEEALRLIRGSSSDLSAFTQHVICGASSPLARADELLHASVAPLHGLPKRGEASPWNPTAWRFKRCISCLGTALRLLSDTSGAHTAARRGGEGSPLTKPVPVSDDSLVIEAGGGFLLVGALLCLVQRVTLLDTSRWNRGVRVQVMEAVRSACLSLADAADKSAGVRGFLRAQAAGNRRYGSAQVGTNGSLPEGLPDASLMAAAVLREAEIVLQDSAG